MREYFRQAAGETGQIPVEVVEAADFVDVSRNEGVRRSLPRVVLSQEGVVMQAPGEQIRHRQGYELVVVIVPRGSLFRQ